jgi:PhnB protein
MDGLGRLCFPELVRSVQIVVSSITPVLTVRNTAAAVEFYKAAFDAIEISRVDASDGQLVVDLAIGQARFRVVGEAPNAFNLSPETLGGTSVRLNLLVEDPDATAAQAIAVGAAEVFPIADQPYGLRQGRFADPFGHHWLIGKPIPVRPSAED